MLEKLDEQTFAAWLAGFTDGEGYIGLERTNRRTVSVRIVVANTDTVVIRAIQKRLGYGRVVLRKRQKDHWKPCALLVITGLSDAEQFLKLTLRFLTVKRPAAELALARIILARSEWIMRHRSETL